MQRHPANESLRARMCSGLTEGLLSETKQMVCIKCVFKSAAPDIWKLERRQIARSVLGKPA